MKEFKLLVTGGRDYYNKGFLYKTLDAIHEKKGIGILIQGGARGADRLAKLWAVENGVHCAEVPALWEHFDKGAGHIRNKTMLLLNPDGVVSFLGGRGTEGMINLAKEAGITVMETYL